MERISKIVFNDWFWHPENVTWDDMKNSDDGIYRPQIFDLLYSFYFGIGFIILRMAFERYIAIPLGKLVVKEPVRKKPEDIKELEKYYLENRKVPSNLVLEKICKQTDMTQTQITTWFKLRRKMDSPSNMKKFVEGLWRCVMYAALLVFGFYVLWDKAYLYDSLEFWRGLPHQHVSNDLFLYYMVELGFYISLLSSLAFDVKRKDFYENCIHHVATILLMLNSWFVNHVRIGSLVMLLHDASDPFLEFAKIMGLVNKKNYVTAAFIIFLVVWIITRLIIFPYRCIRSCYFDYILVPGNSYGSIYLSTVLLVCLQILHLIWTYFIILVIKRSFGSKGMADSRSSDEDEDDD